MSKVVEQNNIEQLQRKMAQLLLNQDNIGQMILHFLVEFGPSKLIEVVTSGKGQPILFLNASGLTAPQWKYQLSAWSKTNQVICVNIPGIGLSRGKEEFSLSGIAGTIVETLKKLNVSWPIHIVGSCTGGVFGQFIAANYQECVASLVLASSSVNLNNDFSFSKLFDLVEKDFHNIGAHNEYEQFKDYMCLDLSDITNFANRFRNGFSFSTMDILPKILAPTLIVMGDKDIVHGNHDLKILTEKIKNSTHYMIKGAGHLPNITHHKEFNNIVKPFIDGVNQSLTSSLIPNYGINQSLTSSLIPN